AEEPVEVTPESALQSYLHNGDENYKWVIKDTLTIEGVTAYDILLTSQKWREHVWNHQLTIFIPGEIEYKGALLFITGGSVKDDMPNWSSKVDGIIKRFALMAKKNKAITAIIRQTPKQPLYDGLVEDQLISFTLHNFKKDKDYTWPLLFPMVKSAVRSMDAIQEFSQKNLNKEIKRFTIAGASKRGWTTWLTGANDQRVEAIGPMVIDVLNMPVSLDYHIEAWNEYSPQIEDYTKLEIPQQVRTNDGDAITTMVDPYSYRKSLTMPKMIFIGTNDEYWPVDAIKNYIDSIPGENFIHYVPNAGHNLAGGEQALKALSAFWEHTLDKTPYPKLNYNITSNDDSATLTVTASPDELNNVFVWTANSDDRDFRDDKWSSKTIKKGKEIIYDIKYPQSGFKAFYIDLEYKDPNGGKYTKSTRMYVVDEDEVL
ncbi:MAG: PhoPQ-activated protein PqaA family protein, partial [Bacteroidota bacterium]